MEEGPVRIIQIMPADGWTAHYRNEQGADTTDRVVCFALVETVEHGEKRQEVRPMTRAGARMQFCQDSAGFRSVTHASEAP